MQSITSTQLAHLQRGGRIEISIAGVPVVGTPFSITDDDILDGSFSLDRSNWSSGQAVEIGNADAAELSFTLDNSDGRWDDVRLEGSTLTLTWDINGEDLAGGIYVVDSQSKGSSHINVSALDKMAKFAALYDGNLTYPATLLQIVQDACADCGVALASTSFTNSDYVVTSAPLDPGITYQTLIAWVAQIAGCNAWIDESGQLRLTWYGDAGSGFEVDASMELASVEHGETDVQITGIRYVREQTEYMVGATGYVLAFADNPLLQDNVSTTLTNIYNKVNAFRFLPCPILPTVPLPHIWTGDVVLADAVSLSASDDGAELAAVASRADIAKVTNGAGISGADLMTKTYRKAAVLVGRHRISQQSDMVGVGETAKSLAYATGQALSSAQANAVKAIATTKVESLAIERTLTVGGQALTVRIDSTSGFTLLANGVEVGKFTVIDGKARLLTSILADPAANAEGYISLEDDPTYGSYQAMRFYTKNGVGGYIEPLRISHYSWGTYIERLPETSNKGWLYIKASGKTGFPNNSYIVLKGGDGSGGINMVSTDGTNDTMIAMTPTSIAFSKNGVVVQTW